ncbi:MAG: hypothetical protein SPJ75_06810 [Candidatus Onthomorpha sp.]|nr:hypothetical protein [Bacteroidales bacterium]MDD7591097.1 hypothetical protein [Bacteroidales bacterium]MDY5826191.1 hypothetical protein [Candidatus Onthomorpha sp.]
MENKQKKDQFVIAYIVSFESKHPCVDYAVQLARILGKGLILLYISDPSARSLSTSEAEVKLKELNESLPEDLFHSYAALSGAREKVLNAVGELLNAVLLVSDCNPEEKDKHSPLYPQTQLDSLASSRVAYLLCPPESKPSNYDKVVLTLNNASESKEKTLWASYFGRFAGSQIVLYYRRYKDEYHQKQLNLNIAFARKIFEQFKIPLITLHSENTKTQLDIQASDYAKENNCSLVICQTTKNKSFADRLLGLDEVRVLKNMKKTPVLFLNPRNDLFILCE